MTWHADQTQGRPTGEALDKLMAERAKLVAQVEALKSSPIGKSNAAIQGRQEDLIAIAKKITSIDKKLGRIV